MQTDPAVVIGTIGGVASGKSTVAELFREEAARLWRGPSLEVVDADRIARELTAQPAIVDRIVDALGPRAQAEDGTLDRPAVANIVFNDTAMRDKLEAIVHPVVHEQIDARLAAARAEHRSVLLDVPLLLERGWDDSCDVLVFLDAADEVRERRARERGWQPGERLRRESAQTRVADKRARGDFTIPTDRTIDETRAAITQILLQLGNRR